MDSIDEDGLRAPSEAMDRAMRMINPNLLGGGRIRGGRIRGERETKESSEGSEQRLQS